MCFYYTCRSYTLNLSHMIFNLNQVWNCFIINTSWLSARISCLPPCCCRDWTCRQLQDSVLHSVSGQIVWRLTPAGLTDLILTSSSSFSMLIKALKVCEFKVRHQKRNQTRRVNMCLLQPGRRRRFKRAAPLINQNNFQMRWSVSRSDLYHDELRSTKGGRGG